MASPPLSSLAPLMQHEWSRLSEELGLSGAPRELPVDTVNIVLRFMELLIQWGKSIDLVADSQPKVLFEKHIVDSLALAALLGHPDGDSIRGIAPPSPHPLPVVDIGTGAGFPGMVLAITLPEREFVLTEPRVKRASFLSEVKRILKLKNVRVENCKFEEAPYPLPHSPQQHYHLVSRAVSAPKELLSLGEQVFGRSFLATFMVGPSMLEPDVLSPDAEVLRYHLPEGEPRGLLRYRCFT